MGAAGNILLSETGKLVFRTLRLELYHSYFGGMWLGRGCGWGGKCLSNQLHGRGRQAAFYFLH